MTYDRIALRNEIERDEGLRLKPYECTSGKLSIGYGRNIEDNGISRAEADYLLQNDMDRVEKELDTFIPWWKHLSDARQRALMNMVYNMGISRFLGFKNMLAALQTGRWVIAADEAIMSRWAKQVGERAERIADMIKRG